MIFNLQSFGLGFISGFATGAVARELTAVTSSAMKPLVKALVKTGVIALQRMRASVAHMGEAFEDILAEVSAETTTQEEMPARTKAKKVSGTNRSVAEASP